MKPHVYIVIEHHALQNISNKKKLVDKENFTSTLCPNKKKNFFMFSKKFETCELFKPSIKFTRIRIIVMDCY